MLKKLPKKYFTGKMKDFVTFTKMPKKVGRFGQINCCKSL